MNGQLRTIAVQIRLSEYGDALLCGLADNGDYLPGIALKHLLFAWHEESCYGTELAIHRAGEVELVVLPAEQVLPFFAAGRRLTHIGWSWTGEAATLADLAPSLSLCLENKQYEPSLAAYREGRLEWSWEDRALTAAAEAADRELSRSVAEPGPHGGLDAADDGWLAGTGKPDEADGGRSGNGDANGPKRGPRAALNRLKEDAGLLKSVRAVFSAAVFERHYGTEEQAADLRREYPMLFERGGLSGAGMNTEAWLVSIGWRADVSPFRPALQLLEPYTAEAPWRLRLVLQDKSDASVLVPVKLGADGAARGGWPAAWSPHAERLAPGWLERLRACLPKERLTGGGDVLGLPLDSAAAWSFLTADSRRLLEGGWLVLLPAWWEAASRRKPRLRAKLRPENENRSGRSLLGLEAIIDFDWRISIGDADLTEEEFAALVARGERLVRFQGRWIPLDPVLLAQIRRAMDGMDRRKGLSFQDVLQLHLMDAGDESGEADDDADSEDTARLKLEVELNEQFLRLMAQLGGEEAWPQPGPPPGLNAELRSYQLEGYAWLVFLRRFGLGACLADDMGLGKTVQLISYLLRLNEQFKERPDGPRPSLIVCPTSVLGNWQKELNRFAPSLKVMLHYGGGRLGGDSFREAAMATDAVLTSYATASLDQELLSGCTWSAVCLDEAQNIKNAQTKQSAAVRSFPALHRIALTGTPIENRLTELWSIYDFMNPGFLGPLRAFQNRFITPIEKDGDAKRTADLRNLVKPFMLRRKKKDPAIQLDLPDKNEMKTYVHLTAEQAALYDQTVNELMSRMNKLEGIERKGAILAALTRLKQLCDHPLLIAKTSVPGEESADEEPPDTGLLIERSAKLERLLAMVKELREEGERCLIFTQYIGMGRMLQRVLREELSEPVLYLNGSTSKSARDRMIEAFQTGRDAPLMPARALTDASKDGPSPAGPAAGSFPKKRNGHAPDIRTAEAPREEPRELLPHSEGQPGVFILSLKAGGVGLNLTAANHVFHFDRWWNPAVENQATDRAYRMGQTRDVQVHKFIALGTLEERIDEMLESKQQLSDSIIAGSEGWITELSTESLKELFTLRREWSNA